MKPIIKIIALITWICLIIASLTGCGSQKLQNSNIKKYKSASNYSSCDSEIIAQNNNYTLSWDSEKYCVLLTNKNNKLVWSSIPYEYYQIKDTDGFAKVQMESPFFIKYFDKLNSQIKQSYGFVEACLNGQVNSKKIANGIRVYYYCDDLQCRIPVDYILNDNGFEARILINQITEGKNPIYSISLMPYLCSAKQNTDSYLFIPSGSGALMSVDSGTGGIIEYYGDVYGSDKIISKNSETSNDKNIYMPVFGTKYENKTITAIIDKGADIAAVEAKVGDNEIGYANVYPTFILRGTDNISITAASGYKKSIEKYTDCIVDLPYVSVKYYFEDENSDYIDMANTYRNYLKQNYKLEDKIIKNASYYLRTIGASNTNKNFLGISYKKLTANTTFKQVQEMVKSLNETGGNCGGISLIGYGKSGLDIEKICGGFSFSQQVGSKKDYKNLLDFCKNSSINVYVDYDVLAFSKSGNGVSKIKDSAKSVTGIRSKNYSYLPTSYNADNNSNTTYLLNRTSIPSIVDKLLIKCKKNGIKGISLNSFGTYEYSDYSNISSYAKAGFRNMFINQAVKLKKNDYNLAFDSPNDYAAVYSDTIFGTPQNSSDFIAFEESVPFYQIVFRTLTNVSSNPINLDADVNDSFLSSISNAIPPLFSLAYTSDKTYSGSSKNLIKYSSYDLLETSVKNYIKKSKKYFDEVGNLDIVSIEQISNNIIKTTFSNKSYVVVNKTDFDYSLDSKIIKANDFVFVKERS